MPENGGAMAVRRLVRVIVPRLRKFEDKNASVVRDENDVVDF